MSTNNAAAEVLRLLELKDRLEKYNGISKFYPDVDQEKFPRRDHFPKHMAFFEAGRTRRERTFIAANKIGKTESVGGYELTLHLNGRYPSWWTGKRFNGPIPGMGGWRYRKDVSRRERTRKITQTQTIWPEILGDRCVHTDKSCGTWGR